MRNRFSPLLSVCLLGSLFLAGCGGGGSSTPSPAGITVSPASLSFSATVGQTSPAQTVTVTNAGTSSVTLQAPSFTGANASDFILMANTCTSQLGPGAACSLSIQIIPAAAGTRTATLTIASSVNTATVALNGTGLTIASVAVTPTSLTFPSTLINQTAPSQTITVANTGGTTATLSTPSLTGTNSIDFAIASTTCTTSIAPNSTCAIVISFTPTASGSRTATITLNESSLGIANTFTVAITGTGAPANLGTQGTVLSGSQPLSNATIQLYTVGATGNGSAAKAMLTTTVTTNAAGNFYLASGSPVALNFTCANATDQVYVVATGGNPGLSPSTTTNPALVLLTALGNCGAITTTSNIAINELTTAAATWALAPFIVSATNIGASATNHAGLANAMLDAQLLANSSTGVAATLATNLTVESGKLTALADTLGPCVNSTGTTACTPLFSAATPSGGTAPNNTLNAALNIVTHPGQNVAAVYALIPTSPLYVTTLTTAPNDWTLTLAITGGGLNSPTAIDIDASGNIWVASYNGVLSGFTPQGTPLSSTGYGVGTLFECYGLTIDTNGNIWVANQQDPHQNTAGSVTKFTPGSTAGSFTATKSYFDVSIQYPIGIAADTNGDIFISNFAGENATAYTTAGAPLAANGTGLGSPDVAGPVAVAADAAHGVWIANSEVSTVTHVSANGTILSNLACCSGVNGSNGVATDSAGNAWISDFGASAFSMISTSASGDTLKINETPLLGTGYTAGPAGVSVDAAQNIWFANFRGKSITEVAGLNATTNFGSVISPATGYGYSTAPTPTILAPEAVTPDPSGNLWVPNNGNNNLIMFFGLATPTKTPVQPTPVAP